MNEANELSMHTFGTALSGAMMIGAGEVLRGRKDAETLIQPVMAELKASIDVMLTEAMRDAKAALGINAPIVALVTARMTAKTHGARAARRVIERMAGAA